MSINFKNYKPRLLISAIIVLAVGADYAVLGIISLLNELSINAGFLRIPSNPIIIYSILSLYDKYLWKVKGFSALVDVPKIHGRYTGDLKYHNKNGSGKINAVLEVYQTASLISIKGYFFDGEKFSASDSKVVEIKEDDGFYNLYFLYHNSGTTGSVEFSPHEGINTLKLRFNEKGQRVLDGHYFNNRSNNPGRGTITVTYVSDKLIGGYNG